MTRAENEALAALSETARRMAKEPREMSTDHTDEQIRDSEGRSGHPDSDTGSSAH